MAVDGDITLCDPGNSVFVWFAIRMLTRNVRQIWFDFVVVVVVGFFLLTLLDRPNSDYHSLQRARGRVSRHFSVDSFVFSL